MAANLEMNYEPGLKDYLGTLRRRAVPAAIVFFLVFAVTGLVAMLLPPTYEATGTILVESQQIPDDLVHSTVTSFADERIMVIKQRVMTQSNLRTIIDKYNLFAKQRESTPASEIMELMRTRIGVELISADVVGNQKTTIAFKVSYDDPQPDVAYKVANELLTLFLDENVKTRTARATETTEFMTQEADRLRKNLDAIEAQIAAYKEKHGDALPESVSMRMNMVSRADSDLQELERSYNDIQAQNRMLDIELTAIKEGKDTSLSSGAAPSPEQQLSAMQTELVKLSATYKPNHPTLQALQRKIDALKKTIGEPASADSTGIGDTTELAKAKVQASIQANQTRMASLAQQMKSLRAQRAEDERMILQAPQAELGISGLLRDRDNAKTKYEEMRAKQSSAQISENLEQGQKAERFALLEPPMMPDKPIKPDRKKIAAMGFFLALASAGGMVMVMESIQQRVYGMGALGALVGQPPLVAIPYIQTQAELTRRKKPKRLWLIVAASVLLLIVLVLTAVNFLYQPLDMVWIQFLARFE